MDIIHEIIQASAALEGSTLNAAECTLLLSQGISSAGKTIKEQLLCLDLQDAYKLCTTFAMSREYWSVFRLKNIAAVALRSSSFGPASGMERVLQKVCDIANRTRLHIVESRKDEMYRGSFEVHYLISLYRPWGDGSNFMGRLLMNYLQYECLLSPTIVRPSQRSEYKRILKAATTEEICEIFVSYMMEHRSDAPEAPEVPDVPVASTGRASAGPAASAALKKTGKASADPAASAAPEKTGRASADPAASAALGKTGRASEKKEAAPEEGSAPKPSSREQIISLLRAHPYMSTRDLAAQIGISPKGIEKNLGILKASGRLCHVGPDKGGHWEVL